MSLTDDHRSDHQLTALLVTGPTSHLLGMLILTGFSPSMRQMTDAPVGLGGVEDKELIDRGCHDRSIGDYNLALAVVGMAAEVNAVEHDRRLG